MEIFRHSLCSYLPALVDLRLHFHIVVGKTRRHFADLPCLFARAWADGRFELLNPAWEELGYPRGELNGLRFCELIDLAPVAASETMRSLLTEGSPLEFGLRTKDRRETRLRWSRRFDDLTTSIFVIGDEISVPPAVVT